MRSNILVFVCFFLLASCKGSNTESEDKSTQFQAGTVENKEFVQTNTSLDSIGFAGKYVSEEGDLEIVVSEGKTTFKLIAVSSNGRTGDVEGKMIFKNNSAKYVNEDLDCNLQFKFVSGGVEVLQEGSCEMGLGVTASGFYKSEK